MAGWKCSACTFVNSSARTICEICATAKSTPSAGTSTSSRGGRQPSGRGGGGSRGRKPSGTSGSSRGSGSTRGSKKDKKNNKELKRLIDMGFSKAHAKKALAASGNKFDEAMNWIFAHPDPSKASPQRPKADDKKSNNKTTSSSSAAAAAPAPAPARARGSSTKPAKTSKPAAVPQHKPIKLSAKEQREKEAREAKRKELERQAQAELEAEKKKEIARRQEMARLMKQKEEEKAALIKEQGLKREAELVAKKREENMERAKARAAKEKKVKTIQQALQNIEQNYDLKRLQEVARLLSKVLRSILDHPEEERYRTLKLASPKVQRVVRPIGGCVLMRLLGFRFVDRSGDSEVVLGSATQMAAAVIQPQGKFLVMPAKAAKISVLKEWLPKFERMLSRTATCVGEHFRRAESEHKSKDTEVLYFCAQYLRGIFGNVIAMPESEDARRIDTTSEMFQRRFSRIPSMLQLLEKFGFEAPQADGLYWEIKKGAVDVRLFEGGVVDLTNELDRLGKGTAICKTIRKLLDRNWQARDQLGALVRKVGACVDRIIGRPHEQKYHRLKLESLLSRYPKVVGGKRVLKVMGFALVEDEKFAVMPYPKGFDIDLLKRRREDLQRSWTVESLAATQTKVKE